MSFVGQRERATQERVVKLFREQLKYTYLGNWADRDNNRNIEQGLLTRWLQRQGVSEVLINKTLRELDQAAALGEGINLYDANQAVYALLRYGVKVWSGQEMSPHIYARKEKVSDHEARIRVVEEQYKQIQQDVREIKEAIKEVKALIQKK